jgi:hypothetical protein
MSRTEKRKFNKLHYVDSELVTKKNEVKALPQSFQMSYHLHRPWSDILLETHLPPMVLERMLKISDNVLADSKRIQWGNNLAGQVKEEPLIEPKSLEKDGLTDFFGNMVHEYVHQCNLQKTPPEQSQDMENVRNHIQVTLNSMWIVEQQPGEYNPIHIHTNCDISAVMYLKVPEFLPSEKTSRDDDGTIYFVGGVGEHTKLKMSSLKVKPKPGDFFIFPSHLMHTVYPYKTNDNFARRSVSFNASFEYKTEL